jgi:hypothetical protein
LQNGGAQRVHIFGYVNAVSFALHAGQRVEQAFNTDKYAAVPTAPALGGNPNRTTPTFLSAFSVRRSVAMRTVFSARLSIRSWQGAIALSTIGAHLVMNNPHSLQGYGDRRKP